MSYLPFLYNFRISGFTVVNDFKMFFTICQGYFSLSASCINAVFLHFCSVILLVFAAYIYTVFFMPGEMSAWYVHSFFLLPHLVFVFSPPYAISIKTEELCFPDFLRLFFIQTQFFRFLIGFSFYFYSLFLLILFWVTYNRKKLIEKIFCFYSETSDCRLAFT